MQSSPVPEKIAPALDALREQFGVEIRRVWHQTATDAHERVQASPDQERKLNALYQGASNLEIGIFQVGKRYFEELREIAQANPQCAQGSPVEWASKLIWKWTCEELEPVCVPPSNAHSAKWLAHREYEQFLLIRATPDPLHRWVRVVCDGWPEQGVRAEEPAAVEVFVDWLRCWYAPGWLGLTPDGRSGYPISHWLRRFENIPNSAEPTLSQEMSEYFLADFRDNFVATLQRCLEQHVVKPARIELAKSEWQQQAPHSGPPQEVKPVLKTREDVKALLIEKKLSVVQAAKRAGIDEHTLRNYLDGKSDPHPRTRKGIADAFGIPLSDLP